MLHVNRFLILFFFLYCFEYGPAYHAYTSCIILTRGFTVIDPSRTSGWARADSGRLFRKSDSTISRRFYPEAFKAQLKEEMYTDNKAIMKELLGEMTKLLKDKQPAQSSAPVDLDAELPVRERERMKLQS